MDKVGAMRIVGSDATVSDKIRALNAAGYPRAEIARLLGKRYQHVRNVLEADNLNRPRPAVPLASEGGGLAEASPAFGSAVRLEVEAGGIVRLPDEVLAALGARPGSVLICDVHLDRLTILSPRAAMARIDARMQPHRWRSGPLASEELIAERRSEAARDSNG